MAPDTLVVFNNSTAHPSFNLIYIVKKVTIGLTMLTSWFSGPVHGDLDTLGVDGHHGGDAADHDHQVKALQFQEYSTVFSFSKATQSTKPVWAECSVQDPHWFASPGSGFPIFIGNRHRLNM